MHFYFVTLAPIVHLRLMQILKKTKKSKPINIMQERKLSENRLFREQDYF